MGKDGKLDHNKAKSGPDLIDFVDDELFLYLQGFKHKASSPNTIEHKIGAIFGEIKNRISSGYNLREIINRIDELRFRSQIEKHELSHLYEAKIRNMGNAGRNGGEYYTPRPLIRAMIKVIDPKIGESIYDGACGSAGFLCEAFDRVSIVRALDVVREKRISIRFARLGGEVDPCGNSVVEAHSRRARRSCPRVAVRWLASSGIEERVG
jgi:type I restriction enzyme M protein